MQPLVKKIASFLTFVFFTANQFAFLPSAQAQPTEVLIPPPFTLAIPDEIGTINTLEPGNGLTILHIQEPHGNLEAQQNIRKILQHLYQEYGVDLVLLEGSAAALHPELIRFYDEEGRGKKEEKVGNGETENRRNGETAKKWVSEYWRNGVKNITPRYTDTPSQKLSTKRRSVDPPTRRLSSELLAKLTEQGWITGPENFLAENPDAIGQGIENLEAYNENGRALVQVESQRNKTQLLIANFESQLRSQASRELPKPLWTFLQSAQAFHEERIDLLQRLNLLKEATAQHLSFYLDQPAYQLDWPMIYRFFRIQGIEKKWDREKYEKERESFLRVIGYYLGDKTKDRSRHDKVGRASPLQFGAGPKTIDQSRKKEEKAGNGESPSCRVVDPPVRAYDSLCGQIRDLLHSSPSSQQSPEIEKIFEQMVKTLPPNFPYRRYPQVGLFIAHLILQSELDPKTLFKEMEEVEETILNRLAKTDEQQKIVSQFQEFALLKKLMRLELSREEWEKIKTIDHRPKTKDLKQSRDHKAFPLPEGEGRVRGTESLWSSVFGLLSEPLAFYEAAEARDHFMLENIEKQLALAGKTKAAVITGGFHSNAFQDYFTKKGYAYALISPKVTGKGEEAKYRRGIVENYQEEASNQKPVTKNQGGRKSNVEGREKEEKTRDEFSSLRGAPSGATWQCHNLSSRNVFIRDLKYRFPISSKMRGGSANLYGGKAFGNDKKQQTSSFRDFMIATSLPIHTRQHQRNARRYVNAVLEHNRSVFDAHGLSAGEADQAIQQTEFYRELVQKNRNDETMERRNGEGRVASEKSLTSPSRLFADSLIATGRQELRMDEGTRMVSINEVMSHIKRVLENIEWRHAENSDHILWLLKRIEDDFQFGLRALRIRDCLETIQEALAYFKAEPSSDDSLNLIQSLENSERILLGLKFAIAESAVQALRSKLEIDVAQLRENVRKTLQDFPEFKGSEKIRPILERVFQKLSAFSWSGSPEMMPVMMLGLELFDAAAAILEILAPFDQPQAREFIKKLPLHRIGMELTQLTMNLEPLATQRVPEQLLPKQNNDQPHSFSEVRELVDHELKAAAPSQMTSASSAGQVDLMRKLPPRVIQPPPVEVKPASDSAEIKIPIPRHLKGQSLRTIVLSESKARATDIQRRFISAVAGKDLFFSLDSPISADSVTIRLRRTELRSDPGKEFGSRHRLLHLKVLPPALQVIQKQHAENSRFKFNPKMELPRHQDFHPPVGNIVPVVTPFKYEMITGRNPKIVVDEAAADRYMKYLAEVKKVTAVMVVGKTGEFDAMTPDLRAQAIKVLTRAAKKQGLQVFAHITGDTLDETIKNARIAKTEGADALVYAPLYKHSWNLIFQYIDEIFKAADLPLVLYDNADFPRSPTSKETGPNVLRVGIVKDLWERGKIRGVKVSADYKQVESMLAISGLPVYVGNEADISKARTAGARGAVGSSGSASEAVQVLAATTDVDLRHALQRHILSFRDVLTVHGEKISAGLKEFLSQEQIDGQPIMQNIVLRKPLMEEEAKAIHDAHDKISRFVTQVEGRGELRGTGEDLEAYLIKNGLYMEATDNPGEVYVSSRTSDEASELAILGLEQFGFVLRDTEGDGAAWMIRNELREHIDIIAQQSGLKRDEYFVHEWKGKDGNRVSAAKLDYAKIWQNRRHQKEGKVVVVTAINPTSAGAGKQEIGFPYLVTRSELHPNVFRSGTVRTEVRKPRAELRHKAASHDFEVMRHSLQFVPNSDPDRIAFIRKFLGRQDKHLNIIVGGGPGAIKWLQRALPLGNDRFIVIDRYPFLGGKAVLGIPIDDPEQRNFKRNFLKGTHREPSIKEIMQHPDVLFLPEMNVGSDILMDEIFSTNATIIDVTGAQKEVPVFEGRKKIPGIISLTNDVFPAYLWNHFAMHEGVIEGSGSDPEPLHGLGMVFLDPMEEFPFGVNNLIPGGGNVSGDGVIRAATQAKKDPKVHKITLLYWGPEQLMSSLSGKYLKWIAKNNAAYEELQKKYQAWKAQRKRKFPAEYLNFLQEPQDYLDFLQETKARHRVKVEILPVRQVEPKDFEVDAKGHLKGVYLKRRQVVDFERDANGNPVKLVRSDIKQDFQLPKGKTMLDILKDLHQSGDSTINEIPPDLKDKLFPGIGYRLKTVPVSGDEGLELKLFDTLAEGLGNEVEPIPGFDVPKEVDDRRTKTDFFYLAGGQKAVLKGQRKNRQGNLAITQKNVMREGEVPDVLSRTFQDPTHPDFVHRQVGEEADQSLLNLQRKGLKVQVEKFKKLRKPEYFMKRYQMVGLEKNLKNLGMEEEFLKMLLDVETDSPVYHEGVRRLYDHIEAPRQYAIQILQNAAQDILSEPKTKHSHLKLLVFLESKLKEIKKRSLYQMPYDKESWKQFLKGGKNEEVYIWKQALFHVLNHTYSRNTVFHVKAVLGSDSFIKRFSSLTAIHERRDAHVYLMNHPMEVVDFLVHTQGQDLMKSYKQAYANAHPGAFAALGAAVKEAAGQVFLAPSNLLLIEKMLKAHQNIPRPSHDERLDKQEKFISNLRAKIQQWRDEGDLWTQKTIELEDQDRLIVEDGEKRFELETKLTQNGGPPELSFKLRDEEARMRVKGELLFNLHQGDEFVFQDFPGNPYQVSLVKFGKKTLKIKVTKPAKMLVQTAKIKGMEFKYSSPDGPKRKLLPTRKYPAKPATVSLDIPLNAVKEGRLSFGRGKGRVRFVIKKLDDAKVQFKLITDPENPVNIPSNEHLRFLTQGEAVILEDESRRSASFVSQFGPIHVRVVDLSRKNSVAQLEITKFRSVGLKKYFFAPTGLVSITEVEPKIPKDYDEPEIVQVLVPLKEGKGLLEFSLDGKTGKIPIEVDHWRTVRLKVDPEELSFEHSPDQVITLTRNEMNYAGNRAFVTLTKPRDVRVSVQKALTEGKVAVRTELRTERRAHSPSPPNNVGRIRPLAKTSLRMVNTRSASNHGKRIAEENHQVALRSELSALSSSLKTGRNGLKNQFSGNVVRGGPDSGRLDKKFRLPKKVQFQAWHSLAFYGSSFFVLFGGQINQAATNRATTMITTTSLMDKEPFHIKSLTITPATHKENAPIKPLANRILRDGENNFTRYLRLSFNRSQQDEPRRRALKTQLRRHAVSSFRSELRSDNAIGPLRGFFYAVFTAIGLGVVLGLGSILLGLRDREHRAAYRFLNRIFTGIVHGITRFFDWLDRLFTPKPDPNILEPDGLEIKIPLHGVDQGHRLDAILLVKSVLIREQTLDRVKNIFEFKTAQFQERVGGPLVSHLSDELAARVYGHVLKIKYRVTQRMELREAHQKVESQASSKKMLEKDRGTEDGNLSKRMEDKQIFIPGNDKVGAASKSAGKNRIVFGVTADSNLFSGMNQSGLFSNESKEFAALRGIDQLSPLRTINHVDQFLKQNLGNKKFETAIEESEKNGASSSSAQKRAQEDITVDDDAHRNLGVPAPQTLKLFGPSEDFPGHESQSFQGVGEILPAKSLLPNDAGDKSLQTQGVGQATLSPALQKVSPKFFSSETPSIQPKNTLARSSRQDSSSEAQSKGRAELRTLSLASVETFTAEDDTEIPSRIVLYGKDKAIVLSIDPDQKERLEGIISEDVVLLYSVAINEKVDEDDEVRVPFNSDTGEITDPAEVSISDPVGTDVASWMENLEDWTKESIENSLPKHFPATKPAEKRAPAAVQTNPKGKKSTPKKASAAQTGPASKKKRAELRMENQEIGDRRWEIKDQNEESFISNLQSRISHPSRAELRSNEMKLPGIVNWMANDFLRVGNLLAELQSYIPEYDGLRRDLSLRHEPFRYLHEGPYYAVQLMNFRILAVRILLQLEQLDQSIDNVLSAFSEPVRLLRRIISFTSKLEFSEVRASEEELHTRLGNILSHLETAQQMLPASPAAASIEQLRTTLKNMELTAKELQPKKFGRRVIPLTFFGRTFGLELSRRLEDLHFDQGTLDKTLYSLGEDLAFLEGLIGSSHIDYEQQLTPLVIQAVDLNDVIQYLLEYAEIRQVSHMNFIYRAPEGSAGRAGRALRDLTRPYRIMDEIASETDSPKLEDLIEVKWEIKKWSELSSLEIRLFKNRPAEGTDQQTDQVPAAATVALAETLGSLKRQLSTMRTETLAKIQAANPKAGSQIKGVQKRVENVLVMIGNIMHRDERNIKWALSLWQELEAAQKILRQMKPEGTRELHAQAVENFGLWMDQVDRLLFEDNLWTVVKELSLDLDQLNQNLTEMTSSSRAEFEQHAFFAEAQTFQQDLRALIASYPLERGKSVNLIKLRRALDPLPARLQAIQKKQPYIDDDFIVPNFRKSVQALDRGLERLNQLSLSLRQPASLNFTSKAIAQSGAAEDKNTVPLNLDAESAKQPAVLFHPTQTQPLTAYLTGLQARIRVLEKDLDQLKSQNSHLGNPFAAVRAHLDNTRGKLVAIEQHNDRGMKLYFQSYFDLKAAEAAFAQLKVSRGQEIQLKISKDLATVTAVLKNLKTETSDPVSLRKVEAGFTQFRQSLIIAQEDVPNRVPKDQEFHNHLNALLQAAQTFSTKPIAEFSPFEILIQAQDFSEATVLLDPVSLLASGLGNLLEHMHQSLLATNVLSQLNVSESQAVLIEDTIRAATSIHKDAAKEELSFRAELTRLPDSPQASKPVYPPKGGQAGMTSGTADESAKQKDDKPLPITPQAELIQILDQTMTSGDSLDGSGFRVTLMTQFETGRPDRAVHSEFYGQSEAILKHRERFLELAAAAVSTVRLQMGGTYSQLTGISLNDLQKFYFEGQDEKLIARFIALGYVLGLWGINDDSRGRNLYVHKFVPPDKAKTNFEFADKLGGSLSPIERAELEIKNAGSKQLSVVVTSYLASKNIEFDYDRFSYAKARFYSGVLANFNGVPGIIGIYPSMTLEQVEKAFPRGSSHWVYVRSYKPDTRDRRRIFASFSTKPPLERYELRSNVDRSSTASAPGEESGVRAALVLNERAALVRQELRGETGPILEKALDRARYAASKVKADLRASTHQILMRIGERRLAEAKLAIAAGQTPNLGVNHEKYTYGLRQQQLVENIHYWGGDETKVKHLIERARAALAEERKELRSQTRNGADGNDETAKRGDGEEHVILSEAPATKLARSVQKIASFGTGPAAIFGGKDLRDSSASSGFRMTRTNEEKTPIHRHADTPLRGTPALEGRDASLVVANLGQRQLDGAGTGFNTLKSRENPVDFLVQYFQTLSKNAKLTAQILEYYREFAVVLIFLIGHNQTASLIERLKQGMRNLTEFAGHVNPEILRRFASQDDRNYSIKGDAPERAELRQSPFAKFERLPVKPDWLQVYVASKDEIYDAAAEYMIRSVQEHKLDRPFIEGLATGGTPTPIYERIKRRFQSDPRINFSNVITMNLDEDRGLAIGDPLSYFEYMRRFFNPLREMDPKRAFLQNHVFYGKASDPELAMREKIEMLEKLRARYDLGDQIFDLQLLGIGSDSHWAYLFPAELIDYRLFHHIQHTDFLDWTRWGLSTEFQKIRDASDFEIGADIPKDKLEVVIKPTLALRAEILRRLGSDGHNGDLGWRYLENRRKYYQIVNKDAVAAARYPLEVTGENVKEARDLLSALGTRLLREQFTTFYIRGYDAFSDKERAPFLELERTHPVRVKDKIKFFYEKARVANHSLSAMLDNSRFLPTDEILKKLPDQGFTQVFYPWNARKVLQVIIGRGKADAAARAFGNNEVSLQAPSSVLKLRDKPGLETIVLMDFAAAEKLRKSLAFRKRINIASNRPYGTSVEDTAPLDSAAVKVLKKRLELRNRSDLHFNDQKFTEMINDLVPNTEQGQAMIKDFQLEMQRGYNRLPSSLKMIRSHLYALTGNEKGTYYALDVGGTNFRVAEVILDGNGKYTERFESIPIPPSVSRAHWNIGIGQRTFFTIRWLPIVKFIYFFQKLLHINLGVHGTGKELFDFFVQKTKETFEKWGLGDKEINLGFTFSFPVNQISVNQGTLMHWNKEFTTLDVVGRDVSDLLRQSLQRHHMNKVYIRALINDTVGTHITGMYLYKNVAQIIQAVIMGSGRNSSMLDFFKNPLGVRDYLHSFKFPFEVSDHQPKPRMFIVGETGGYVTKKRTKVDTLLDKASENPGQQWLEKETAGKYLGEKFRLYILEMIWEGIILKGQKPGKLKEKNSISSEDLDIFLSGSKERISDFLFKHGVEITDPEDFFKLKILANAILDASAYSYAFETAAIHLMADPGMRGSYIVAVDGALFEKKPGFKERFEKGLRMVMSEEMAAKIEPKLVSGGSKVGAAIAAAAVHHKELNTTFLKPLWEREELRSNADRSSTVPAWPAGRRTEIRTSRSELRAEKQIEESESRRNSEKSPSRRATVSPIPDSRSELRANSNWAHDVFNLTAETVTDEMFARYSVNELIAFLTKELGTKIYSLKLDILPETDQGQVIASERVIIADAQQAFHELANSTGTLAVDAELLIKMIKEDEDVFYVLLGTLQNLQKNLSRPLLTVIGSEKDLEALDQLIHSQKWKPVWKSVVPYVLKSKTVTYVEAQERGVVALGTKMIPEMPFTFSLKTDRARDREYWLTVIRLIPNLVKAAELIRGLEWEEQANILKKFKADLFPRSEMRGSLIVVDFRAYVAQLVANERVAEVSA